MRFLHRFELEGQVNLNTDAPHLYDRITTASLSWKPCDAFNLTLGKQVTRFTYEGSTSTTQILTFERSLITSMVWPSPEYVTGAVASGKVGSFFYQAGLFSGDQEAEFSQFNGGAAQLYLLGYDFSKSLGMDKASVRADYFHNDGNADYLYSHKLKLMTGVEYSDMKDSAHDGGAFNGWTWLSGIRMYF